MFHMRGYNLLIYTHPIVKNLTPQGSAYFFELHCMLAPPSHSFFASFSLNPRKKLCIRRRWCPHAFCSLGSFFDFRPTEGAFEANPPFVRDVILKMANHMEHLLKV